MKYQLRAFLAALLIAAPIVSRATAQTAAVSLPGPFGVSIAPNGAIWTGLYWGGSFAVLSADATKVTGIVPTAANPTEAAFFGNLVIYSSEYGDTVYAVDRTTRATQWTLNIPSAVIANVAVGPAGVGYVTSEPHTLTAFNPATGISLGVLTTGSQPRGIAVSADGSIMAVANKKSATIDLINTDTMSVTKVVPVGRAPTDVVISGDFAYASNYRDATVSKLNLRTGALVATGAVGLRPRRLATNGSRLFVANQGSNSISILNARTMATIRTIPMAGRPRGLAVNAAGTRLFVANYSGNAIDTYNVAAVGSHGISSRRPRHAAANSRVQAISQMPRPKRVKGALVDLMFALAEWRF